MHLPDLSVLGVPPSGRVEGRNKSLHTGTVTREFIDTPVELSFYLHMPSHLPVPGKAEEQWALV